MVNLLKKMTSRRRPLKVPRKVDGCHPYTIKPADKNTGFEVMLISHLKSPLELSNYGLIYDKGSNRQPIIELGTEFLLIKNRCFRYLN